MFQRIPTQKFLTAALVWTAISCMALGLVLARKHIPDHLPLYWTAFYTSAIGLCAIAFLLVKWPHQTSPRVGTMILVGAVLLRLPPLLGGAPTLSDDIYRYLFDGKMLANGISPYWYAPSDEQVIPLQDSNSDKINQPHLVTIYLPVSQIIFTLGHLAGGTVTSFKLIFTLFDLATVWVLLRWLAQLGRSAWWAVLYAWHPLVVSEFSGSGHQDTIGIFLLTLALWQWESRRVIGSTVALALSACVKPHGLLAMPTMLRQASPRQRLPMILTATVVVAIVWAPFALLNCTRLFDTAREFGTTWQFNRFLYDPLASVLGKPWGPYFASIAVIAVAWFRSNNATATTLWAMLIALLFAGNVNPWYAGWLAALLPIVFWPAALCLTFTLSMSYVIFWLTTPGDSWILPRWIVYMQYLPVCALLIKSRLITKASQTIGSKSVPPSD